MLSGAVASGQQIALAKAEPHFVRFSPVVSDGIAHLPPEVAALLPHSQWEM